MMSERACRFFAPTSRWSLPTLTVIGFVVGTQLTGCTHSALRGNTVATASTLTDLYYQMVLSNLAMAVCRPGLLPWHLKVTQGVVAATDSANPTFMFVWPPTVRTAGFVGSRSAAETWTVVPETDAGRLHALQEYYATAVKSIATHYDMKGERPPSTPYGSYGECTVWPKQGHWMALTLLTDRVLDTAAVQPGERTVQLPGASAPAR